MEFKGTKRANEYCNSIEERNPYEDYLNGYNQALKDSKASEMLEMLSNVREVLVDVGRLQEAFKVDELIKQATEL